MKYEEKTMTRIMQELMKKHKKIERVDVMNGKVY